MCPRLSWRLFGHGWSRFLSGCVLGVTGRRNRRANFGDGNIEAVKQQLANGTDVNAQNGPVGRTPLHEAALRGHKEVVELVIDKDADVNAKNWEGGTPLHYAALTGRKEIAELLIDNGADVNAKDDDGSTPLRYAVGWGHKEIVELLIANGADVNVKSKFGETPLDLAIINNETETAAILRKHGAKTGEELKDEGN